MLVTRFWQSVVTGETLKYLSILPTEMEKIFLIIRKGDIK